MGVIEVVCPQAGAEQEPEDNRLPQRAEDAIALTKKSHQLTLRERADTPATAEDSSRVRQLEAQVRETLEALRAAPDRSAAAPAG